MNLIELIFFGYLIRQSIKNEIIETTYKLKNELSVDLIDNPY